MPLTVTGWPDHPDSRSSHFALTGFAFGQVPPWKFLVKTTGASPAFDFLNQGALVTSQGNTSPDATYDFDVPFSFFLKEGFDTEQGDPPATVIYTLHIEVPGFAIHEGKLRLVFPDAIQTLIFPDVDPITPGSDQIPNPVVCSPRAFDAEL